MKVQYLHPPECHKYNPMSWIIILEDEDGERIASLSEEFAIRSFNDIVSSKDFRLIKYLDPFGDTFFNKLQMKDLILDLEDIAKIEPDNKLIDEIISLAKKCLNQQHLYIAFYGD